MNLEEFATGISAICSRSLVAPGRPLVWTIIANPTAGGFTIPSRWKSHRETLNAYIKKVEANPRRVQARPSRTALEMDAGIGVLGKLGLIATRGAGHGNELTKVLLDEAAASLSAKGSNSPFYLIITAGGDGTSLEVLNALFEAPETVRSNTAVLRLPMGTGNDGADSAELAGALDLLIYPVRIGRTSALRLTTATGKGPFLAFNILSVGLDAFVTHMTNKMKGRLPGDSYKLWVDIASLLYDRLYRVGPMEVRGLDGAGKTVQSIREEVLLLAVGISGHRSYGSHNWILPDDRNVCVVRQMPLLRKVALKGLFATGGHVDKPESTLFNAQRVEFTGEYPILAQMDGETVRLQVKDYPAAISLTEPVIPVLVKQSVN
ncbi:diacylglycerol kinase [Spirochaetia bacterium]|nr:diacylglycerol kinase [Spirochaetia bacterium]